LRDSAVKCRIAGYGWIGTAGSLGHVERSSQIMDLVSRLNTFYEKREKDFL